jgi:hypothetical protein
MGELRIIILVLLLLWVVARSDRFLVVGQPEKADVIVVLAGETDKRPARRLELAWSPRPTPYTPVGGQ